MSMKKIIAGVAAAALTVGSLAVVGVSAADPETKTFNFVGKVGSVKLNYSVTNSYMGGEAVDKVFEMAGGGYIDLNYFLEFFLNDDRKPDYLKQVNDIFKGVKYGKGTKITVTGTSIYGRTISVTATASHRETWDLSIPEGTERFRVRKAGDNLGAKLNSNDIDLSVFEYINTVTLSSDFEIGTEGYSIAANAGHFEITPTITGWAGAAYDAFKSYWTGYTSESKNNDGRVIKTNTAYALEGQRVWNADYTNSDGSKGAWIADAIEIGADANGVREYAESLGHNTLRWVNDNIVQNKGAKLKINFMTPNQLSDAITSGGIDSYVTRVEAGDSKVLSPTGSSSSSEHDVAMGVNLQNTTKLQDVQDINLDDYSVTFDWDKLVQNSVSTISGNVSSIAFRLNPKGDGVKKISDGNGNVGIKSIEIIIPDQATVPTEEARPISIQSGSSDCFVKLIGSFNSIYGNGAQDLVVTNDITNNNVSYKLKLTDATGAYVQPAGEVTLQLSIPTDFRGATLTSNKVKHTCNDGTVEELDIQNFETYKTDNYIVVKTSKFSDFSFGFETTEATEAPATEAPATEAPATEAPATEAPATEAPSNTGNANGGASADKNAPTGVVLAVVPAAVAAAAVVISKKRK